MSTHTLADIRKEFYDHPSHRFATESQFPAVFTQAQGYQAAAYPLLIDTYSRQIYVPLLNYMF